MQQKFYDPKTGMEKKPSYDGEGMKAAKPKFDLNKEAGIKPKPTPTPRPRANDQLVDKIVKAIADMIAKPSGSSQPQMAHEDAERVKIMMKGAPLNPQAGGKKVEAAMSDDGVPAYDGRPQAASASTYRGRDKGSPPILPPQPPILGGGGKGTPPILPPGSIPGSPPILSPQQTMGGKGSPPILPPVPQMPPTLGGSMPSGTLNPIPTFPQPSTPLPPPMGGANPQVYDGIAATMKEFKRGTLHSGSKTGPKVKSRKQAIAIGMNQDRKKS